MKALELFGQNLKRLRKSRDLTQEQLGEQLNLSRNQINNYENAMFEPSMETLLQISSFFNVSLDLLCNGYSNTNDVLLRNTLEEVQQTYAALEEPKRKRFCKQLVFYSKVLAETDGLLLFSSERNKSYF
ncbi:helix-turn-helix domain-containing protein [Bacillus toyonensis]|uniref:helix-turn-helix domain-containing protein n=1 Tax=Bacillus toyonensis TaxID=155322 RepID=UPI000BFD1E83|nr:transcriptional regulator [Bacillus toyonensis]